MAKFKSVCRTCDEEVLTQGSEEAYRHFERHSNRGHDVTFYSGIEQGDAGQASEYGTAQ